MKRFSVRQLTTAGIVGGLYAALTVFGSVFGISYGPVQLRFAEALCVLPYLLPETAWGLGVGCLIANLFSPYGLLDILIGSLTTLLAGLLTARCRRKYLAPLPPVVLNALLIGALLAFEQAGFGSAFDAAFAFNAASVGGGELLSCGVLGLLLLHWLPKVDFFKKISEKD